MAARERRIGIQQELHHQQQVTQLKQRTTSHGRTVSLMYLALVVNLSLFILFHSSTTLDESQNEGSLLITASHPQSKNTQTFSHPSNADGVMERRRHLREVSSSSDASIPFPKTLVGIFTTLQDSSKDWHRQNLAQYPNQEKICALGDYEHKLTSSEKDACQIIYTFVIGGNDKPNAPTELLTIPDDAASEKQHHSLLVDTSGKSLPKDVHENDCILLNIRENENDGKSQTFFYFASLLLKEEEEAINNDAKGTIDYIMKIDAQTKVHWGDFLEEFAVDQLPTAPYNINTIGGAVRDKAMWWGDNEAIDKEFRKGQGYDIDTPPKITPRKLQKPPNKPHPSQLDRLESFWGNEFGGVHLYVDGQLYFMSSDLVHFVANEALYAKSRIGFGGYLEGMEDHDISGMVWHAPSPIHMIPLTKSQRFWDYPAGPE